MILDFGVVQGRIGRFLRGFLKLLPRNITLPVLQGAAFGKLWRRASGVDGYWLGSYEKRKQELFASLIRPGNVIYDIGANVGFYTLVGACAAKGTQVFAFEPEARNFKFLQEHISLNNLNAVAFQLAISDQDGTAKFLLGKNPAEHKLDSAGSIEVPCRTIDSLAAEGLIRPPDVIKIDVEGADDKVLAGAKQTLEKSLPHILVETGLDSSLNFLKGLGYRLEPIGPGEFFAASPRF